MFDIEIDAPRGAHSLALIGQALGAAGVSLEGGGMWAGVAHYLIADPNTALRAIDEAGLGPATVRPVLLAELDADLPGALGQMMARLTAENIALHIQYSDHDNRKVLVVDDVNHARSLLGQN